MVQERGLKAEDNLADFHSDALRCGVLKWFQACIPPCRSAERLAMAEAGLNQGPMCNGPATNTSGHIALTS